MHSRFLSADFENDMEFIRAKLAKSGFGVTLQGHHLTLRTNRDGKHMEVSLLVSEVQIDIPCCDSCSTPFTDNERKYPVQEEIRHDGRVSVKRTIHICGQCAK